MYTSILFTKIIFLERFRNVVQAIVNKNPKKIFGLRPKGVLFKVYSSNFKICVGREGWTRNTFFYAVPLRAQ